MTMMNYTTLFLTVILFAVYGSAGIVMAQAFNVELSRKQEQDLKRAVKLLVQSDRQNDFAKLYELLAFKQRSSFPSFEEFVDRRKGQLSEPSRQITEFKVKSIARFLTSTDFYVTGCGKYNLGNTSQNIESHVFAVMEDSKWRFRSFVGPVLALGSQEGKKCS